MKWFIYLGMDYSVFLNLLSVWLCCWAWTNMLNHDRVWANRLNERTTPSDGIEQAGWTHAPTARTSTFLFPMTSVLITGFVIFLKPTAFVLAAIFNQQLGASRDLHRLKYPKRTFSEYHRHDWIWSNQQLKLFDLSC